MRGKDNLQFDLVNLCDTAIALTEPCATHDNLLLSMYILNHRSSLYNASNNLSNLLLSILSRV